MRTSPPTGTTVRFGVLASALGVLISCPDEAKAQVVDAPAHRVQFTVSPSLPKCNDYDAFYGILVNWVRIRSIDPTANRKLVVNIERQLDGRKLVKLALLDAEGVEIAAEAHPYSATEECFKVLYWTAWDSAKLLRTTVPPPEEEPPVSIEKLVEQAERPERRAPRPADPAKNWPGLNPDVDRSPTQCEVRKEEVRPLKHVVLGVGVTAGLTGTIMPGVRIGVGRTAGPLLFELNAHVLPPLAAVDWGMGGERHISARAHGYLGSFALCAQRSPLIGCAVAAGGFAGYVYDQPLEDGERFSPRVFGGVFHMGLRAGVDFSLSPKHVLRFDVDALLPLYVTSALQSGMPERNVVMPMLSGFLTWKPLLK